MANANWLKILAQIQGGQGDKIPKGYRQMREWLEEFEIGETSWRRRIPLLEKREVMIRGYFRVYENGRTIRKPFWKRK